MKNAIKIGGNSRFLKINPLILFVFCIFLYPPKLISAPFLIPAIIYIVSIIYILLNWKILLDACLRQRKIIFLAVVIFIVSLIVPILYATDDFSYAHLAAGYFFKKGIIYLFLLCLLSKRYGKDKLLYHFLYYFAVTHFIYVIGTLILVSIPSFQNFWFNIFNKEAEDVFLRSSAYTFRIGWQGFAGFTLTLNCTISIIFLLFLRYGLKVRLVTGKQFAILFVGCLAGNMFYGRIGLVVTLLVTAIAIIFWNRKHLGRIALFITIPIVCVSALNFLKDLPYFSSWYNWMSRPIVNLINYGEFDDSSFDRLQEMNQVEISSDTFLFGDGIYNEDDKYYMSTDAGFVRNILFWGIFGAILSYGLVLYSIYQIRKISKIMMLELLITFLAFEYKGSIYYEFILIGFILMIGFYASDVNYRLKRNDSSDSQDDKFLIAENEKNERK